MKSSEYVAAVTNTYRKVIDGELFDQEEAVESYKNNI